VPKALPVTLSRGFHFFYSEEGNEPAHVHVEGGDGACKWWLEPVEPAWNDGVKAGDMRKIRAVIEEHRELLLERWREHAERK